jgi:hypothetical protein
MPKGANGQSRPADVFGAAVTVAKLATGEEENTDRTALTIAEMESA